MADATRALPGNRHDDPSSLRPAPILSCYLDYRTGGSLLESRPGSVSESAEEVAPNLGQSRLKCNETAVKSRRIAETYRSEIRDSSAARHLNLARTVDSGGVAVQKKADHHLGGIGRLTATVLRRIRGIDGAQIKRRDHIDQKAGQVPLRKPIVKRRWEHQDLVDRVR